MNFTPAFWAAARIVVSASGAGLSARGGCRDSGTSAISGLKGGDTCSGRAVGPSFLGGTVAGTSTPIAWSCSKIEAQESDPMAYSLLLDKVAFRPRGRTVMYTGGTGGTGGTPGRSAEFGGTDRWDRWDHHERLPIRARSMSPGNAGPTGPTRRYRLLAPNPVQYHRYHLSHQKNGPED